MSILTPQIKDFIARQKLCFVATVNSNGTPNLSPKGTTMVWDDNHIMFADIHSPGTVNNLLKNPSVEINMVDVFLRKGYRFKGTAKVLSKGPEYSKALEIYGEAAKKYVIRNIVIVNIERVLEIKSPAYDDGTSEEEIKRRWVEYWSDLS